MPRGEAEGYSEETDMPSTPLTYYPIYMHKAHPLDGTWVKLSAKHLEELAIPPGWEASHPAVDALNAAPYSAISKFALFHYLNHPLPYIQVCGVVVEIDYKAGLLIVTLDDSSGRLATGLMKQWTDPNAIRQENNDGTFTSKTKITEKTKRCRGWMNDNVFDIEPIRIGSVIRIKGRFSQWERGNQILVEKYDIFRSTSQEIDYWRTMCREFENVLSKPWHISQENMLELTADFEQDKIAREKHTLRLERRARRKKKEKEARARDDLGQPNVGRAQSEEAKVPKPSPKSIPVVPTFNFISPPRDGLAPSYQIPKKDSSAEASSSLDTHPVDIQKHTNTVLKIKLAGSSKPMDTNCIAQSSKQALSKGCDLLNVSELSSPRQYHTFSSSSVEDPARTSRLELLDTGTSSYWKQVNFSVESDPVQVFHGTDWLNLRDELSSQKTTSVSIPIRQTPEAKHPGSVIDEWNNLVL